MSVIRRLKNHLKNFSKSQNGSTAVIFGLAAVPLFLAVGAAMDITRLSAATTQVQAALDAGALAGAAANAPNDSAREDLALKAFMTNLNKAQVGTGQVTAHFDIKNGVMTASAEVKMNTTFMRLAGINEMPAKASNEINLLNSKKAEIALVLDYSGSMEDPIGGVVKYKSMRDAAVKLIDDLAVVEKDKVKVGLVPFSHHVLVSLPAKYVAGQNPAGNWQGCTVDRKAPYNTGMTLPVNGNENSKWGQPQDSVHADWGCNGYKNDGKGYAYHNLRVKAVTSDLNSVKSQLQSMTPYAWTHIALGVEFGMQLLSDTNPFKTPLAAMNDAKTQKYMVVLTDGMQTEPAYAGNGSRSVAQGEANLEALCVNAKAKGIKIITLAFDLDDSSTRKRLQACASDGAQKLLRR